MEFSSVGHLVGRGRSERLQQPPVAPVSRSRVYAGCENRAVAVVMETGAVFARWSFPSSLCFILGSWSWFLSRLLLPLFTAGLFFSLISLCVDSVVKSSPKVF